MDIFRSHDALLLIAATIFALAVTKLLVQATLKWSKGFGPPTRHYSPRRAYDGSKFWGRKYK